MKKFVIVFMLLFQVTWSHANEKKVAQQSKSNHMTASKEKVLGLGGVFFKAKDPKMLAKWYQDHLGITQVPSTYDEKPWIQREGPTVFAPFSHNTKYFGRDSQQWMINFRVKNLKKMVKQLEQAGIEVKVDPKEYPNGYFARLYDPEGNPIELWQPK